MVISNSYTGSLAQSPNDLQILQAQVTALSADISRQSRLLEALLEIFKPRYFGPCYPGTLYPYTTS